MEKKMDLSKMYKNIAKAAKNNEIEVEDPEKTNLNLKERAREYMEALEEITAKEE